MCVSECVLGEGKGYRSAEESCVRDRAPHWTGTHTQLAEMCFGWSSVGVLVCSRVLAVCVTVCVVVSDI